VTLNVTDAWPAGIVTVTGTVAFDESLVERFTTSEFAVLVFRVMGGRRHRPFC